MGTMLIPLVVLVGMWFFMARSQKKNQNERQSLLDSMKKGDSVVTVGGLHGIIDELDSTKGTVTLDCDGIFLEFDRTSIRTVNPSGEATTTEDDAKEVTEEVKADETTEE